MKKKIILILSLIVIFITSFILYSIFIYPHKLIVKEYNLNGNVSSDYYGMKIIHFGDIHYKHGINKDDLDKIVEKINLSKPDIVLFSGDLLDKGVGIDSNIENELIECLSKIEVRNAKIAIKGDEDDYKEYETILKKAGFTILEDNYELVYNGNTPIIVSNTNSIDDIESEYKILLIHEPDNILSYDYNNYNLVLAGHSQNGQIILPFIGRIHKFGNDSKYFSEYYKLDNTDFYITSGIGLSDIKLRINCKPSINLFRLK